MSDWEDAPSASSDGWEDAPSPVMDEVKRRGKAAIGGLDAGLAMAGSLPAYAAGGLMGLGTLLSGQGLDKAAKTVERVAESNFGLGKPKPFTKEGEEVTEMVGEIGEWAIGGANQLVSKVAGDAAGNLAGFATEMALELSPIPGYKGVKKLARKREGGKKAEAPSTNDAAAVIAAEKARTQGLAQKRLDIDLSEGPGTGEGTVRVGKDGTARAPNEPAGLTEGYRRQQAAELDGRMNETAQMELFDQPESGRVANPTEAVLGDWRIDENGMPIKADLSMEAQNLQNPLQRNLWGDEMPMVRNAVGQNADLMARSDPPVNDVPLTQAIDSMAKGEGRDAAVQRLQGAVEAPGELRAAQLAAETGRDLPGPESQRSSLGSFNVPKGQRGAINPAVFVEGFQKIKELAGGVMLKAFGDGRALNIIANNTAGEEVGRVTFIKPAGPEATAQLKSDWTAVAEGARGKGLSSEMYAFASELGNDIRQSPQTSAAGKGMWEGFERKGLAADGVIPSPGNRQRGGLWMGAEGATPQPRPDSTGKPTTPESIAEKQKQQQVVKRIPLGKADLLNEFQNVTTKEEAIALSKGAKDILRDIGQKDLGSGIGFHAAISNSPALKFARYVYREARVAADQFSKRFITDNKTGLTPLWSKMKTQERVNAIQALMEGDRQEFRVNEAVMDKLGFSDPQRQFVRTFYDANETMWNKWVETLEANGLKLPKHRTGQFPGIFIGSYKTIVQIPKKDRGETVGVIAVDTIYQRKAAEKWFKENYPDAKLIHQERTGLSGTAPRYYSNIFSGMNDMLDLLGRNDPRFAEVQDLVNKAITAGNNKLFNFNVHELAKKGVVGNEGNRPWLDAKRNADDAFKALVRYFEEGALHHELQVPLKEVRDLAISPELDHLPNTKKLLDKYTKKVTGADLSPIGAALNTFLDLPFKLTGIGPDIPLKMAGTLKNNMSQIFMGYGNYMFTAVQLIQPMQTGLPFLQLAATRIGANSASVAASMARGGNHFLLAWAESKSGKKLDILPEHMRTAFEYAKDRGLLTFSEIERAYQGTQGDISRVKDTLAEANMKLGENMSRTPMFMAYVDLLVNAGVDVKKAMPIAEHMTQFSMVDYHEWERPMVYSRLGVMGPFAGGLATFKHGQISQQAYLARQAIKPEVGDRQIKPLMLSVAALMTVAGVTGMPGYDELDAAVIYLTDKFGDDPKNIRELALANNSEWVNSGIISNWWDLNIQSKFSAANMVPDSVGKAMSPHLEGAWKIMEAAIDMVKNGADEQSVRNFLMKATPSAWKGVMEDKVARNAENQLIGTDGKPAVNRSEEDWQARKITSLRPHKEALERESTWTARIKERKDQERKKEIVEEYKRRLVNNTLDGKSQDKLRDEFLNRGGQIRTLIDLHTTVPMEMQQTQKERMQGIPRTPAGLNRWEYYNK